MTPLERACLVIYRAWALPLGHEAALAQVAAFVRKYRRFGRFYDGD